ncbi:hypothetical protein [Pelagibius sp.]|uniref:hypothetical protein n=1 Tax=Pelagibius sp. TaxID=1931238 RepID=UPI00260C3BAD|nr:hypothetical protein [Pelagibius sp.]
MSDDKTEEGAALWRRAHDAWTADAVNPDGAEPDPMVLAAYLDGRLSEAEAAALEARMAADPSLLDEVLALRAGLAESPQEAPPAAVAAAQALRRDTGARSAETSETASGFLERLFAGWLRPAVPALAVVALVLACAGAFELGRYQSERILPQQANGTADKDLPDPLSLDVFL